MDVRVLLTHGRSNLREMTIRQDILIGRNPECDVRIASTEVSRRHCEIRLAPQTVSIHDLGSANGTFVNDRMLRANETTAVRSGDSLALGPLRFVLIFAPPDAPPSPADLARTIQQMASGGRGDEDTVDFVAKSPSLPKQLVSPKKPDVAPAKSPQKPGNPARDEAKPAAASPSPASGRRADRDATHVPTDAPAEEGGELITIEVASHVQCVLA